MKTSITHGLEKGLAEEIERQFQISLRFRERLIEMLNKKLDSISVEMRADDSLEKPNWELTHASRIGEARAIQKLIQLLE